MNVKATTAVACMAILAGSVAAEEGFSTLENVSAEVLTQKEMAEVEGKNSASLRPYYGGYNTVGGTSALNGIASIPALMQGQSPINNPYYNNAWSNPEALVPRWSETQKNNAIAWVDQQWGQVFALGNQMATGAMPFNTSLSPNANTSSYTGGPFQLMTSLPGYGYGQGSSYSQYPVTNQSLPTNSFIQQVLGYNAASPYNFTTQMTGARGF